VHGIAIVRFSELLFTTNGLIMRAAPMEPSAPDTFQEKYAVSQEIL
jgi:hypothetical protein